MNRKRILYTSFITLLIIVNGIRLGEIMSAEELYEQKIEFLNEYELSDNLDSGSIAFDNETKRLFLSDDGLKMYNVSNPTKIKLINGTSTKAHEAIRFFKGHLFTVNASHSGEKISIFTVNNNKFQLVGNSSLFMSTVDNFYFANDNLMITTGGRLIFWDISDLQNITKLVELRLDHFFYGLSLAEVLSCVGIAFHPDEPVMLLAINRGSSFGELKLVDYSYPSNPVLVDFDSSGFPIDSTIKMGYKNGLVSNGCYPCLLSSTNILEVLNWTNATQPLFGNRFRLSTTTVQTNFPKIQRLAPDRILVYRRNSGIVDISDLNNIRYLTDHNITVSLFSFNLPIINNEFIYCLDSSPLGHTFSRPFFIKTWRITPSNTNPKKWTKLAYLAMLPLIVVPFILIRRAKLKRS